MRGIEDRVLIGLVIVVSAAMVWIMLPYYGAILWALAATLVFQPVNAWLLKRNPKRPNQVAMVTLLIIIAVVIIPAILTFTLLVEQAVQLYNTVQTTKFDLRHAFEQVKATLPGWASTTLDRNGWGNVDAAAQQLTAYFANVARFIASQALTLGQGAASFFISLSMMLYLTFFLLRDGKSIGAIVRDRIPLRREQRTDLVEKFATVVRATVKGNIVVAAVQGALGGFIFWVLGVEGALLWGVVMALMSLIPLLGSGVVWVPVALYLLATGSITKGIILILFCVFVIGLIDNLLRPILVGRDTRMPDYMVLLSTVGGLSVFGINGFIVGPVIAAMFFAAWDIFSESRGVATEEIPVPDEH